MEKDYKGYTIKVEQDEYPLNPRTDCDNLGTMVCFHNRYDLGDRKHGYNKEDYNSWDELKAAIIKKEKPVVILPIYMYDHSGITIATAPFNDRWDSGQIGFIFVSRENALNEYGAKRVTKYVKEMCEGIVEGEIETYDKYIRGEVLWYSIEKDGEEIDSCGGWFYDEEYVMNEAEQIVDNLLK